MIKEDINQRNYGIDLLRIVSMIMIIFLHLNNKPAIPIDTYEFSIRNELTYFIQALFYCAANCFGLISGYVGINSKHKYSNIVYLWLTVVFYSVIIGIINCIFVGEVSLGKIIPYFFPLSNDMYWYFTEYFCLFLFLPIINAGINSLNKKQNSVVLFSIIMIVSVYQKLGNEFLLTDHGYSALWLSVLYYCGAYIKKYDPLKNISNSKLIAIYVIVTIISYGYKLTMNLIFSNQENLNFLEYFLYKHKGSLISYLSPTILAQGICLLGLFCRFNMNDNMKRIVKYISPLSFSAYIIHMSPFVFEFVSVKIANFLNTIESPLIFSFGLFLSGILLFMSCVFIDDIRLKIFQKIKLKESLLSLEKKYLNIW